MIFDLSQVREWATGDKKKKMCNARSGWSTMSFRYPLYKNTSTLISTNTLIDILEVRGMGHGIPIVGEI